MRQRHYITAQHSSLDEKGEMVMREGRSNDDDAARHANCVVLRMLLMQVTSFLRVITHIMAALLSFAPPSRYLPSIWGDFDDYSATCSTAVTRAHLWIVGPSNRCQGGRPLVSVEHLGLQRDRFAERATARSNSLLLLSLARGQTRTVVNSPNSDPRAIGESGW